LLWHRYEGHLLGDDANSPTFRKNVLTASKKLIKVLAIIKQQTAKEVSVGILNYLTDSIHKTLAGEARIV
jgi:hypothetical protein